MNNLWRDLRFGFRLLRKNPGFAAVAVLALALGIGANTAIYSIVYATLLEPLPYYHPNEVVMVWSKIQGDRNVVAAGDYLDWKRESTVFQGLAAWNGGSVNLATASHPEQVQATEIPPGFFTSDGAVALPGTRFSAGGRRGRQEPRRHSHLPFLVGSFQWRPLDRGHDHSARRRAVHGGRSSRSRSADRGRGEAGHRARVQARANQSRFSLAFCHGASKARSHHRAGERGHGAG